jgi:predicted aminopeptidase
LAGIATYRELVPGFQALLQQCQGELGVFYTEVRTLSKLPEAKRLARLKTKSQLSLTVQY